MTHVPRDPVPGQLDILVALGLTGSSVGVQQHRGIALPANTKSVARPSRFGNPFRSAPTPAARAEAVTKYREYLARTPQLIDAARDELTGFNLACYCPLDGPCHRDVLLELINRPG